ncbi:class I SAM-dependent methyltransferase [Ideonella sp. B7]|uniref:SAM-dependent methyltransferase n=1 Tax=Ideonella benzenivorans TaxID=2831643 RepID=UPI001CEC4C33|nr:class I SAM-dependent methyltransferase [Ideonella benzenivorans]MCA6215133.1 class I SAM-dependent methyltransferase [Ideonella benzenivorans]
MSQFWDERFAEPGFKYGLQPNAFLKHQAAAWVPGQVLLPGDGEGRNSVWLALQGHTVLAVDSSAVGLAKGQALAREQGVADRWSSQQADLSTWVPPQAAFDAVVLVYVHLPSAWRTDLHRRLAQALKPGGRLLLEGFHPEQLRHHSGGPKDPDMLMTLADLRHDFDGLLTEQLGEEVSAVLDEGPGHQGLARVTRYIGLRP